MTQTSKHPFVLLAVCLSVFVFCRCGAALCQDTHTGKGSYFPLSVGNSWVYTVRGPSQTLPKKITWEVTQREVIDGTPVFHLWLKPAGDDEPLSLSEGKNGIVEADSERFLLKYPLHPGDRWSVKSRSLRAPGKLDVFEVVSVGTACSVEGHSFSDCATVREVDEANNVKSLTTYARGVGPVKYVYFKNLQSEDVATTLTVSSWQVH